MTNPKVNGIARLLEADPRVAQTLARGHNGVMGEIVTRNVMRHVTVSSLVTVWGAANEHTEDGIFPNADLSDLDDIAGIPGFGEAMQAVGWAEYHPDQNRVILPNFEEWNTSGKSRAAERQRRYRERQKGQQSDVTRDVTVTPQRRDEKRGEVPTCDSPSEETDTRPREVFDYWMEQLGKNGRTKFSGDRRRKVEARLKEGYTVEDLKRAVDGIQNSPHHMGENTQGIRYDDLELICRVGSKVEHFRDLAESAPQASGPPSLKGF